MPVVPPAPGTPFASASDLEILLQRTFTEGETDQANLVLDLVTAAIRSYTGQTITTATTTELLRIRRGKLRLAQRPVTAVTAVTTNADEPVAVTYEWDGFGGVSVTSGYAYIANGNGNGLTSSGPYLVTYTHGYATVPDDIRAVTLQVAARSLGTPADSAGLSQESIGSYSYSIGAAAAQGSVGFLAGERAVLDRYKLPASAVVMERL